METTVEPGSILPVVMKPASTSWPCQVLIPQPARPRGTEPVTLGCIYTVLSPGKPPGPPSSTACLASKPRPAAQRHGTQLRMALELLASFQKASVPTPRSEVLPTSRPFSPASPLATSPTYPKHHLFQSLHRPSLWNALPTLPICPTLTHPTKTQVRCICSGKCSLNTLSFLEASACHFLLPWMLLQPFILQIFVEHVPCSRHSARC